MVKFTSVWSGQPIWINPAQVQSVMQRREINGGKWWWVAGHTRIMLAGGEEEQPSEDVVGSAEETAERLANDQKFSDSANEQINQVLSEVHEKYGPRLDLFFEDAKKGGAE